MRLLGDLERRVDAAFAELIHAPWSSPPAAVREYAFPSQNVKNLVLLPDVMAAVERGEFHIWAIKHIDEGLELLSGLPAGTIDDKNSFHGRVEIRIREMAQRLKAEKGEQREAHLPAVEGTQEVPHDPRPPLPGLP